MKWLITGSSGLLGHSLCNFLVSQGIEVVGLHHTHPIGVTGVKYYQIDLLDYDALKKLIRIEKPDVLVHSAGLTNVDACETNEELAKILHAKIPQIMATVAKDCRAQFVNISTDHLWDGSVSFITEEKPPQPINAYARTKYLGELKTLEANANSLILRTNFFGRGRPWRMSLSDWVINSLKKNQSFTGFTDVFFTPIELTRLSQLVIELVEAGASGIFNLAGCERVSKYNFSIELASHLGLNKTLVLPGSVTNAQLLVKRPTDMSLSVDKIETFLKKSMPSLSESFTTLKIN
jgi:dTDP-4-dehydrorhamnose reductase